jgi:PTS system N-acetylgalactosamine-specific IIC component
LQFREPNYAGGTQPFFTVILFAAVGFLLGFLGASSMTLLSQLVALVPQWLLKGLSVAGGMLPGIGFAMILSVMLEKKYIPFALLGYIAAAYLKMPVIGVALVGCVFAIKHYNDATEDREPSNLAVELPADESAEAGREDWI